MWSVLIALTTVVALAHGHGRVLNPAGRGSLWRAGFSTRANYDDDGLNCGGFYHQYSVNDGKCGICGDPFDAAIPRPHELGGIYGDGIISGRYQAGSLFTATIELTAYHKGFWEFKICPDPDNNNQECFDANPVELESGGTQYYPSRSATYSLNYRLPAGLACDHCVLQWRYTAGNNWGVCNNGTEGLGCGNQEQFGACSDIAIEGGVEQSDKFVDVDSLLLSRFNTGYLEQQGLIHLLWKGAVTPYHLTRSENKTPRYWNRLKQRRNHKKKVKPFKSKKVQNTRKPWQPGGW